MFFFQQAAPLLRAGVGMYVGLQKGFEQRGGLVRLETVTKAHPHSVRPSHPCDQMGHALPSTVEHGYLERGS